MSDKRTEADGGGTAFDERIADNSALAVPLDIGALLVVLAVSVPIILGLFPVPDPVRVIFGIPFVMLLPGYALTTALFPTRGDTESGEELTALGGEAIPRRIRALSERGLTGFERAALGFGVSLILAPLFGVVIDLLSLTYQLTTVVAIYGFFTGVVSLVAVTRHYRLPPQDAAGHTLSDALSAYRGSFSRSGVDTALVLLVTLGVLFAGVSGALALVAPQDATSFSGFMVVSQTDDGNYVAGGYPDTFVRGEPQMTYLAVRNDEQTETTFTAVAQMDRVQQAGNGDELTVVSRNRLARTQVTLAPGETQYVPMEIAPESVGENLRLTYLLYKGEPPQNPTTENAYRSTYLWINSTAGGS